MEEKDWGKNIFFPGGRKCSTITASFSTSSAISSSARQSVAKQYNRSKDIWDIYFPRKQSIKVIKLIQKSKCIFSNNKTDQKIYIVQCAKNQKICLLMLSFCQIGPKLDQKNYDQTTKWELVRRSMPSQMEVQVRKGGRHHHRTKVSRENESISNRCDGKVTKSFLAGATSAACGKASSPPWRRHHRRWASRYREADIESELASQVRNHGHNISKIWWNPPIMKSFLAVDDDDTGIGLCGWLLTSISLGEYPFVC